jgi:hypothetical protein
LRYRLGPLPFGGLRFPFVFEAAVVVDPGRFVACFRFGASPAFIATIFDGEAFVASRCSLAETSAHPQIVRSFKSRSPWKMLGNST